MYTKKQISLFLTTLITLLTCIYTITFCGCASGGTSNSQDVLRITLKISEYGNIDTQSYGYYAILFNSLSEPIEVTNYETFTDFIRYDGANFIWFHRQGNVPSPGYTWVNAGTINSSASISSDGSSIVIRIPLKDDTHPFNRYIESNRFTSHVLTTDASNSLLGKAIDTLGTGPSFSGNTEYTIFFDKTSGILEPVPPNYPEDPVGDYKTLDGQPNFPYDDYDIEKFKMELE